MPPVTIDGTSGITTPMYNGTITANAVTPSVNMKNRIINGNMSIDQRNAGASVTVPASNVYTVDRWSALGTQASKFTVQQSTTAPSGFVNSLKLTSSSAYSLASTDAFQIQQYIEGYNVADLGLGTTNASTITISFWVQASLTGTYGMWLTNNDGSRIYPTSYTINSANTWEYKTITLTGDLTGSWTSNNTTGLRVVWTLGYGTNYTGATPNVWNTSLYVPSGCVNFVGTNGATFYITGVQLEVGSTATSFDYRPYGTELALCQRYFQGTTNPNDGNNYYYGSGSNLTSSIAYVTYPFLVSMRASPTLTSSGTFNIRGGANNETVTSVSLVTSSTTTAGVNFTVGGATLTQGYGVVARSGASTANTLFFSAEL